MHLKLTTEEAVARLQGEWAADVAAYDRIHRHILHMSDYLSDGLVKRFAAGQGRQFAYQIVACDACDAHLHLKCTTCGSLYHMDHAVSEQIMREVLSRSDFSLDEKETVLFGVCKGCKLRQRK